MIYGESSLSLKTRVTIICSNNGKNCLGRALLLGDLLLPSHDVVVLGVQTTAQSWEPGASFQVPVRSYPVASSLQFPGAAVWLRSQLRGSRVIVCKPKPTSMGLALAAGVRPSRAILDVDDWDLGFGDAPSSRTELLRRAPYYLRSLLHPARMNSYLGVRAAFDLVPLFPTRLVSNGWLQHRIGGHLLPHVRDCKLFDPDKQDVTSLRAELALGGRKWVGFIGTVRPHKGIEDLIAALASFSAIDAPGLLLAGLSSDEVGGEHQLVRFATEQLGVARVRAVPRFPFSELPRWLAIPDVLCIPSRPGATSAGQIPAKMFDALAMGRPLVVSNAHDTRDVDADAAIRFEAGNVVDLARKLQTLFADEQLRGDLAKRARAVALAHFDYDAGRRVLVPLMDSLEPS